MLKSKKLLASTLTILLSSTSSYAVDPAPVRPRSVKVPAFTGPTATFSNGVGLDRGNIPINAVKMGYFLIPNGKTLNPNLADKTVVTFQRVGGKWTAFANGVALAGQTTPAFFSESALNPEGRVQLRATPTQLGWEDITRGDEDFDDAVMALSIPHTEINDISQLVLFNGTYTLPLIIKYQVQQRGLLANAGYNNSVGHYFADAAGNLISGYIDFASIKTSIGATSTQPYSGNDQFGAGSTLQYEARATAVADIAGTNIAAVDVSTIPTGGIGDVILRIDQSAKLGSVVNSDSRNDNQLSVQITGDKTLTLTGTGGILFNGKGAPVNNYNGLKEIKGLTANNAVVEFANQGFEISLNAPVGTDGKLKTLRLLNNSVELKKDLSTNTIEFTNADQISALKLTGGVADLGSTNVVTSSTSRNHNIWISSDQNISGNIGSANNPLGVIKFLANKKIKVNTNNFYTDVYTQTNNTGTVEFVKNGAMSYSLGEDNSYLLLTKFTESAEVRGSAYSKNISVAAGKTARFVKRSRKTGETIITPYVRTSGGFALEGIGSTVYFGDQAEIYNPIGNNDTGNITTNVANEGIVQFEGSAQVRMHIGTSANPVKQVDWLANDLNKTVILARNVYAKNINMSKATYNLESDRGIISGNTTANSPTINFGQHIETFTGGQTTFTGSPIFNVYFDNKSNSHLTVSGAGSNMNLAPATSITFNVTDYSTLPPAKGRVYYFYRIENGATLTQIDPTKVTVNQTLNPFMKWNYSFGNLTQTKDISNGLRTLVLAAGGDPNKIPAALLSVDTDSNGSASKFIQDLSTLIVTDPAAASESLRRVIQATNPTGQVTITTTQNALSSIVSARINNTQLFQFRLVENDDGIAAGGSTDDQRGVWISPFMNQATQKSNNDNPGYKSKAYGGSIGFDNRFTDNLVLGIAGTFLNTDITYKNFKSGDKTKINTFLGSIYGLYNLPKNWFVQGILSAAWNKVKNTKPRISLIAEQAESQYNSQTYGVETAIGYDYKHCEWLNVMPLGGLRYGRFNGDSYREKNTLNQNLTVSRKKIDKIEAIAGLKLATIRKMEKFTVIPEIHGFINYDLKPKAPKVYTQLDGAGTMPAQISKPARALYNLGLGVKTWYNMIEYEAAYDSYLSKKYTAHQGTLKLKLNF